ncbi:MAG: tRNA (guanosine(37)-N1)-methyltransferase TrmD [Planctomycetota bacterium]
MRIDILTLFPEMFTGVLDASILRRAARDLPDPAAPDDPARVRRAVTSYHIHNIRDHSADAKHAKVDSPPYGGGPGMVMQCQPVWDAVRAATAQDPRPPRRILTTPKGRPLTQALCETLAAEPRLMIVAGHYEGLDQRVIDRLHDDEAGGGLLEISVGDYVLSGGELPAMTIIDSVVRLLPGALGHADSAHEDSFSAGVGRLLDHPHYTRPPEWEGMNVPDVLTGGNHAAIDAWRADRSHETTRQRRPDLLAPGSQDPSGAAGSLLVTLRDAGPDDRDAVVAVHAAAFPTDAEAKLTAELLRGHDVLFSIAAESQGLSGSIVGHALLTTMTHEHGGSVRGLAGLAPLAVAPEIRGRGIGRALVREAIRQCRENRVAALFVLGDPAYYGPLGFQPASEHGFTNDFDAGDAFGVIILRDTRPIPPGRVSYAPAFGISAP